MFNNEYRFKLIALRIQYIPTNFMALVNKFPHVAILFQTLQEKAQALWRFIEIKWIVETEMIYRRIYQKAPPWRNSVLNWKNEFLETGSILNKKVSELPSRSEVYIEILNMYKRHSYIILKDLWDWRQVNWIFQSRLWTGCKTVCLRVRLHA